MTLATDFIGLAALFLVFQLAQASVNGSLHQFGRGSTLGLPNIWWPMIALIHPGRGIPAAPHPLRPAAIAVGGTREAARVRGISLKRTPFVVFSAAGGFAGLAGVLFAAFSDPHPGPSPEIAADGVFTRAEWIPRGASDMTRIDVMRGGTTGARKTAILAEAPGLPCEVHVSGWGSLHVCGATAEDTSEYFEKGPLAPGVDYDAPHPFLAATCDRIDTDGLASLPGGRGPGYEIVWDYIRDSQMTPDRQKESGDAAWPRTYQSTGQAPASSDSGQATTL